jgi:hypothetical protein
MAFLLAALLLCAAATAASAKPLVVKPAHNTLGDLVIAEAVFAPPAPPETDAAPALQGVIDAVSKAGGGTVYLPAGTYTVASRVTVREGVTLRGDNDVSDAAHSTLLRITADKGNEEAPAAFTIERGSGLVGLSFWYPEQRVPDPIPYPWTVKNAAMPANDNQTIADCTFINSWKAICIGPEGNELHTFRKLRICALKTGISIDSTTDIGRICKVSISPGWWSGCSLPGRPSPAALQAYLLSNDTVAVDIGRSDWEYICGLFVDGYRRGLVFRKGVRGTTNAVMAYSLVSGCAVAVEVSALNQVGFSAYGCIFDGKESALLAPESFDAVAQFHSCNFVGAVQQRGSGVVTGHACALTNSVVDVARGQWLVQDSAVGEVRIGAEVTRARLFGFDERKARIVNAATNGDVMVCARNPYAQQTEPQAEPKPGAFPRPPSDALFVVSDFGASETNDDNAAAFQAALDAAGKAEGGGTVYVPAGLYRFRGGLTVPTGVELRGCFDVPHHTVSAGSVLMAYHNQGKEDGPPFVSLKEKSGLRGLTFWYPEQPLKAPVPYPWTVRALGAACWIRDVTIGNAWQGVDFATHRSDGHMISYLAGAMFRRGLFVGNCKGEGFVEDVQFNPHYAARLPARLPRVYGDEPGDAGGHIIQFQREHLEGLVFTDCRDEYLRGTFLYAAYDGLSFKGLCKAQVLMHGTDTGSRAAVFETSRGSEIDFALAQLVSLGDWAKAAIVTLPKNAGDVRFYNSQIWAGPATAVLEGGGTVRLEQFNTLSGPIEVRAGTLEAVNGVFDRELPAHIAVSSSAKAEVIGTVNERGPLRVEGDPKRVRQAFNSASVRPAALPAGDAPAAYASSFEPGEPEAATDTVVKRGGGVRKVSDNRCGAVERRDAHSGRRALLFQGVSDDPAYSFAYQVVHDKPIFVMPDTVLSYWHKPLTAQGRSTALDLLFSDGRVLREAGLTDSEGRGVSPGAKKGEVGQWTRIAVSLGQYAGLRIETVMAAYDTRKGGGRFEALFDDLRIEAALPPAAWRLRAEPVGGRVPPKCEVLIAAGEGVQVRYTLDGSNPGPNSPLLAGPLKLPKAGAVELRYAPLQLDGGLSRQVFAELYEIE